MTRQADDAYVEREIPAAELRPDAARPGGLEDFVLQLGVTEGLAQCVAFEGQRVEVFGRGELDGLEAGFGRGTTDDDHEVIGRARGGAQMLHLVDDERLQALRVQQRLGLLKQEGFVGRTAALGDKEKFIARPLGGVEIDLRREVRARVDLLVHVERDRLRVTEILLGVGLVDALGEVFGIVRPGPDLLAFFRDDGGRAGVLTEWQDALRRHLGVAQHRERDISIVRGGLGVVEDGGDLLEMLRAEQERTVAHRLAGEVSQGLGVHLENLTACKRGGRDEVLCQEAIRRLVFTKRERFLIAEGRGWHGAGKLRNQHQ